MDRSGADFFNVVKDVREKLGANAIALQVPIGSEESFKGVVDLITNQAIIWNDNDMGMTYEVIPIPEDLQDLVIEKSGKNCWKQLLNTMKVLAGEILRRSGFYFC